MHGLFSLFKQYMAILKVGFTFNGIFNGAFEVKVVAHHASALRHSLFVIIFEALYIESLNVFGKSALADDLGLISKSLGGFY